MKPLLLAFLLTSTGLSLAPRSLANDPPLIALEGFEGEVEVTLKNAEFVKVQVNGVDTDRVEFAGKVAIIKGFDLEADRANVTLTPISEKLGSVELEVVKKDFKKVRKGKILRFVAKKTATFPKAAEGAPTPPPEKEPKAPDVAPPPPEKDL